MQVGRISDCTRVLGKCQGYTGLPVRDELFQMPDGERTRGMRSVWFPSPAELAALNAGASIELLLLGSKHPPVIMSVGEVPE
jgi:hypothetical protein